MAGRLHFSLVAPERQLYSAEVDQVDAPGVEGDFGVLYGHAPFMTALKAGHFYSSQGPEIHDVAVENGKLQFACSPAAVAFVSGRGSRALSVRGREISRGELPIDSFADSYCRLTVVDETGKRAWTNPIWLT